MLRSTFPRCFAGSRAGAGGAGASWFGKQQGTDTLWGCAKAMIACLCGIALVNVVVRGNPIGHATSENDLYQPDLFRRRSLPEPTTHGFVGSDTEEPIRRSR